MTAYHLIDRIQRQVAAAQTEALQDAGNGYYAGLAYARRALGDDLDARTDLRAARVQLLDATA